MNRIAPEPQKPSPVLLSSPPVKNSWIPPEAASGIKSTILVTTLTSRLFRTISFISSRLEVEISR